MKVIQNTYPHFPNVPRAEVGDEVHWEHHQCFHLVRNSDNKRVFATAPVDRDGNLRSNGEPPLLVGIIAQVKSKGWILSLGGEESTKKHSDDRADEEKYYPKPKGGKK